MTVNAVTVTIGLPCTYNGEIASDGFFQNVRTAIEFFDFFAFFELSAPSDSVTFPLLATAGVLEPVAMISKVLPAKQQ